jgi:hypothetical protein
MNIKRDDSFSKVILNFSADFDPEATRSVPIDYIWVMLLMHALMYAKDL